MSMVLAYIDQGGPFAAWQRELRRHLPECELRCWPELGDRAEIIAALAWNLPAGAFRDLPNLRLIQALGAGADHLLSEPSVPKDVPLLRLIDPGLTAAMSEYVALQVLRLHRQDLVYLEQQRQGRWRELRQPNAAERRVGVLGLGVLGGEAALRLKVLGFDVAGWSRTERRLRGIATFHGAEGLRRLLARSEILVCLLPLTPETEDMLDARLFAALPRGAAIVNCGRGRHLVEADLLAALASGQLSAAVLDVCRVEPLPPGHPFWSHPRIVLTPHCAAATNPRTAAPVVAAALRCLAEGKPLPNRVDRLRHY